MHDIKIGTLNRSILVFIPDPASTDGSGKTGLTHADLTVSYTRVETDNDVVVTDVTSSLSTLSALTDDHTDWGVKQVSSTLAPGLYRLDIADAVFAAGAWEAVVYVMITSSEAAASPIKFRLVASDPGDMVTADVAMWDGANVDADTPGYPKVTIKDGSGQGEILLTSGKVDEVSLTNLFGSLAVDQIETAVDTEIEAYRLHYLVDSPAATVADDSAIAVLASTTGVFANFVKATDSLQSIRDNMGTPQTGDAYAIVNSGTHGNAALKALIDTLDNFVDTEIGTLLTNVSAIITTLGSPDGVSMSADIAAVFTVAESVQDTVGAIVIDTNELQTDWANGGRLDLLIDGIIADLPQRFTKNTALAGFQFFMRDTADHVTGKTGLTITATRSLDGAAFGACTNAASEIGNGWYKIDLAADDMNGNAVALRFTGTGADSTNLTIVTQPT